MPRAEAGALRGGFARRSIAAAGPEELRPWFRSPRDLHRPRTGWRCDPTRGQLAPLTEPARCLEVERLALKGLKLQGQGARRCRAPVRGRVGAVMASGPATVRKAKRFASCRVKRGRTVLPCSGATSAPGPTHLTTPSSSLP